MIMIYSRKVNSNSNIKLHDIFSTYKEKQKQIRSYNIKNLKINKINVMK